MSCTIIEPGIISINGSPIYRGGAITNATFNLSTLGSQTTADISFVQAGNGRMSTPSRGEDVVMGILGKTFKMQVGKYSMSNQAAAATSMTITLYDLSNRFLDQDFIVLNDEFPTGTGYNNCHPVGGKYGSLPNDLLVENYILAPNSDTQFGHLRAYFLTLQNLMTTAVGAGGAPFPKMLGVNDIEELVASTPGKGMYWTDRSSPYAGDVFRGAAGRKIQIVNDSLYDVIGPSGQDVLGQGVLLPAGVEMQETGSFRTVLNALVNKLGWVAYWDLEKDAVNIISSFNTSAGFAALNAISSQCEVTAASDSEDFTTSFAKGAVGSITTSVQGQNQNLNGGKMSRYLKANLLTPVFSYRSCTNVRGRRQTLPLPSALDAPAATRRAAAQTARLAEVAEAMTVATQGSEEWCHFVVEEILKDQLNRGKKMDWEGKRGAMPTACGDVPNQMEYMNQAPKEPNGEVVNFPAANSFIVNYYTDTTLGGDLPCTTDLYAIGVQADDPEITNAANASFFKAYGSASNAAGKKEKAQDEAVEKVAGLWKMHNNFPAIPEPKYGEDTTALGFSGGMLIAQRKKRKIILRGAAGDEVLGRDAIIGEDGFVTADGGADTLRKYLCAVAEFYDRFYVVHTSSLLRSARSKLGNSYGYHITSSDLLSGLSLEVPEGYEQVAVDPYASVGDCTCPEIQQLASALVTNYAINIGNGTPSLQELLSSITTIDFIAALDSLNNNASMAGRGRLGPPRNAIEKLIEKGVNIFGERTTDNERTPDPDAPQLRMILIKKSLTPLPSQDAPDATTIVQGGVAYTMKGSQEAKIDIIALNNTIKRRADTSLPNFSAEPPADPADRVPRHPWCLVDAGNTDDPIPMTSCFNFFAIARSADNNFFKGPREPFVFDRAPNSLRVNYVVEGSSGQLTGQGQFFISSGNVPEKNVKDFWKASLDLGLSIDATDVGLENEIFEKFSSAAATEGSYYSAANKVLMKKWLDTKVANNVWTDRTSARSQSISFVVGKNTGISLPSWDSGMESISISNSGGRTTISIKVGDSLQKRAQVALFEMIAKTATFQHVNAVSIPDTFRNNVSQKFYNLST